MRIPFLPLLFLLVYTARAQNPAFPGAEGYGMTTSGGRGGAVLEVTTLADGGEGSLRHAVESSGMRTIVFKISGTIALESELIIQHGDLTIAGQTAPGDGICIKNYPVSLSADNIIIRFLRFRPGDEKSSVGDALSGIRCDHVIIDHCSMSWGIDEVASFYDNSHFTMQWCLVTESLHSSCHPKGPHGYGGIWGGQGASFHHNLLAHHSSRTPRFNGDRTARVKGAERVDFRNNVIYNWGQNSAYGGEGGCQNIIANMYISGPATREDVRNRIVNPWDSTGLWHVADNGVEGFPGITEDNWAGGIQGESIRVHRSAEPFPVEPVSTQTPSLACALVLAHAGAVLPRRDAVDSRIIKEVRERKAVFGGVWGPDSGIIDSQKQAGGWPALHSAPAPVDEDHDGMPDEWERTAGLDPADPSDRNGDLDGDGFTNLEEYLNGLVVKCGTEK